MKSRHPGESLLPVTLKIESSSRNEHIKLEENKSFKVEKNKYIKLEKNNIIKVKGDIIVKEEENQSWYEAAVAASSHGDEIS